MVKKVTLRLLATSFLILYNESNFSTHSFARGDDLYILLILYVSHFFLSDFLVMLPVCLVALGKNRTKQKHFVVTFRMENVCIAICLRQLLFFLPVNIATKYEKGLVWKSDTRSACCKGLQVFEATCDSRR